MKKLVAKMETLKPKSQGNKKVVHSEIKSDMAADQSIVGLLKGSVLRYDNPTAPAFDPIEWNTLLEEMMASNQRLL